MKAVILAGGKGTRLKDVVKDIPKPMAYIGDKPILQHQIELLHRYGIKDIILLIGYLGHVIQDYFGDGSNFGVNIDYFIEEKPLGTAGGIKEVEDKLGSDFLALNGDVMLDINLNKLIEFHHSRNSSATLVLHPNDHPQDSDLVEIDNTCRISKFYSKPHNPNKYFKNLVNAGVYVLSSKALKYIEKGVTSILGKDVFPVMASQETIYGYVSAEYMKDMGTPDRFKAVCQDHVNGKIRKLNNENPRPAIFLDRDGVVNEYKHLLHNIEDMILYDDTGPAIKKINKSEYLAIVITNQSVIARNLCSVDELEEIHRKLDILLGRKCAKLDALYYCPHHPDSGYPGENSKYKIECDCRKPKTGLITRAREKFNIDLEHSYLIGDSCRDILCGKNAGVKTIGLKRGEGCKAGDTEPDYLFDTLSDAVDFILSREHVRINT